jgi:chromate reductase, NAD(P)H dehydrogenase (quinone)
MKLLAISGSARGNSTNTALLRAVAAAAPQGMTITVFDAIGHLPVFSPDLEGPNLPPSVAAFIQVIERSEGIIIASPEYVRTIPGGLKNAIDWLVSGDAIMEKPVALLHASHRGDDILADLRRVLATVSTRFAQGIFLRIPVVKMTPDEISQTVAAPDTRAKIADYLNAFSGYCR